MPTVGEWIHKLAHPCNELLFSAKKKRERSNHEQTWRNLKCVLLSERSQSEEAVRCMIPYDALEQATLWRPHKDQWLPGVQGGRGRTGGAQGVFSTGKMLCVILSWWIHVITHFSKPIE